MLWWLVSLAWGAELRGVVQDEAGTPLSGVDVIATTASGRVVQVTTDAGGAFAVQVADGPVTLRVLSAEHTPLESDVVAAEGMPALEFRLSAESGYEVVVLYYDDPDPVVTRRSVTAEEVARVPGGFGDPVRVVTSLPGAARPPFGSSQLVIRGGNDDDTSVFIDGVEVPIVYHVGGYRSVVHPSMVAEVDFLPGVFPSRYGDTTSGLIDIQTRADWSEQWETSARVDLLDASASVRGTVADGALGIGASVRRSYIDAVLAPFSDSLILPNWFDYQVQMQTLGNSPHTLRLTVLGLEDRAGSDEGEFGITSKTSSHRGILSWVYQPNDQLRTLVQPSVGWDDDQVGLASAISVRETGLRLGLRTEARWAPTGSVTLVGGAQVQASNLEIEAELPFSPTDPTGGASAFETTDERWIVQPDPYAELQLRPLNDSERLVISAGVRAESMLREGLPSQTGVSPRGSVRFEVFDGGVVKGGAGLLHQMPNSRALAFSGDTELALERAATAEVGWEQDLWGAATFDAVVYGRSMDRIATQQFGVPSFDNSGLGRAYGLELLLRKNVGGPLFGWVSYSLQRSERIPDPKTDETWILADLDQTHNLIAIGGYQLGKGWDVGARFQYTSGNPFTPYDGAVFDLGEGTYTPIPAGDTNSARIPAYYALDLRVSKAFTWKNGSLSLYLDLLNVVAGENPELAVDAYDYTEVDYVTGLPTLPVVGAQLDWRF